MATPVHPRVYGEHSHLCRSASVRCGSSPCIRGTYSSVLPSSPSIRFIPVYTGNIAISNWNLTQPPVHPRVYGEHLFCYLTTPVNYGSSPCIRGTFLSIGSVDILTRFIPVYTGNMATIGRPWLYLAVHPRVYGEHVFMPGPAFSFCGSSPCIRGT